MTTKISEDVLEILTDCTINEKGTELMLPDIQLERKLYLSVNKVLVNMGGKWDKKKRAHVFETDIDDVFDDVVELGEYEAKLDELNKVWNFFETPPALAEEMYQRSTVQARDKVLEPSAGRGAIAAIIRSHGNPLLCIEKEPEMAQYLREMRFNVAELDFLEVDLNNGGDPIHTANVHIIANPPFSGGRDATHIMHMIEMQPLGIVSIASSGLKFRQDRRYTKCREMIEEAGGEIHDLPPDAFKASGTMVNAVMVVI